MGRFHFAGKHYQLNSRNECGSIDSVNAALKRAYGFDFRVRAVIGSDILGEFAIFIGNKEHKIYFAGSKSEMMTFTVENSNMHRASLIIEAGSRYKLEIVKGVNFIIEGNNHYLLDTTFPKSITEVGTLGGLYFAGDWYPLPSKNEFGSLDAINTALKRVYGFDFRVNAVIGSDIIGEFAIFIDNQEQTVYFPGRKTGMMAFAVKKGHADYARLLIEAGADVNAATKYGETALMMASQKGHLEVVRALLAAGADVNAADSGGWTVLMKAARNGHTETAQTLLAAGADVNAADSGGWTALTHAAMRGRKNTVQALLDAGADAANAEAALRRTFHDDKADTRRILADALATLRGAVKSF